MEEADYLFRHAALRDAAYHLHLPSERARLHRFVFEILEASLSEDARGHLAMALADHAHAAQQGVTWSSDGLMRKELEYLKQAAANAAARYERDLALQLYQRVAQHALVPTGQRVDAIVELGTLLWFAGQRQAAIRKLDEAVQLASNDLRRLAFALIERGTLYRDLNQYDRAERDLRLALDVSLDAGDRRLELRARGNLATVLQNGRKGAEVEALFEPVLQLATQLADTRAIGISKGQIASGYGADGDHARAEALLAQSLDLLRKAGDRMNEAVMLSTLGHSLMNRTQGDVRGARQRAVTCFRDAVRLNREIGNRPQVPDALAGLAGACLELGLESEAWDHAQTALAEALEVGKPAAAASALAVIGSIHQARREPAQAEAAWHQGLRLARESGSMETVRALQQRLSGAR